MALLDIPFVPSVPNYRFTTTIGGTSYIFDVLWNDRELAWYFDVLASDQTPIVNSIKVVLGIYLGRRSNDPLFTNGVMVAVDVSNKGAEAGIDDLGTRVRVRYIPVVDLLISRAILASAT